MGNPEVNLSIFKAKIGRCYFSEVQVEDAACDGYTSSMKHQCGIFLCKTKSKKKLQGQSTLQYLYAYPDKSRKAIRTSKYQHHICFSADSIKLDH